MTCRGRLKNLLINIPPTIAPAALVSIGVQKEVSWPVVVPSELFTGVTRVILKSDFIFRVTSVSLLKARTADSFSESSRRISCSSGNSTGCLTQVGAPKTIRE